MILSKLNLLTNFLTQFLFYLIYFFRTKKYSNKRRESLVVHDRLADSEELSTKKVSFVDKSHGSVETEKPG